MRLRREIAVGSDGTFEASAWPVALDDGQLVLARAEGYAPATGRLDGLRIALRRAAIVEGFVKNADGSPAAHVRVGFTVDPFARDVDDDQAFVEADEEGRFRITEADPAARLHLVAMGSLDTWVTPVPLAGRLRAGRTLAVDLSFETGQAVELQVRVPRAGNGLAVDVDGGIPAPLDQRDWATSVRPGPHRVRLRDAAGKVIGERTFVIPIGARGHEVRFEN